MAWTLITGAAKGLGSAISLELAAKGYPVVIHYHHSQKEAEVLAQKCRDFGVEAQTISGDLSSPESTGKFISEYVSRFSETHHLINNVGNYLMLPLLQTPISECRDLFQTNFFAPIEIIQALVPAIKRTKGSVINIGVVGVISVSADIFATAYTITKLSLLMATKSLAKELMSEGIRVNMVSPGYMENAIDLPDNLSDLPAGRAATLHEVARVVSFLCDPKNNYITGQNIEVAGGIRL